MKLVKNMNNKNKKGFTLIELLVVIAIIGILSGTVIVSMSGAQSTAKDSRIKSGLGQLRTAAEVYKYGDGLGEYTNGVTAFNTDMDQAVKLIAEINAQGGTAATVRVTNDKWCAHKPLISSGAGNSCVDYRGYTSNGSQTCTTNYICE